MSESKGGSIHMRKYDQMKRRNTKDDEKEKYGR